MECILEIIIKISNIIVALWISFLLGRKYESKSKITNKEQELIEALIDNRLEHLMDKYEQIQIGLSHNYFTTNIQISYVDGKYIKTIIDKEFLDINYLYEYIKDKEIEKEIKSFLYDYKN